MSEKILTIESNWGPWLTYCGMVCDHTHMQLIYDERVQVGGHEMSVRTREVGREYQAIFTFDGQGSKEVANAFIRLMDDMMVELSNDKPVLAIVDARALTHVPVTTQLVSGRALLRHRKRFGRIVIVGAMPMVRRVVAAILRAARFDSVHFCRTVECAHNWVGFSGLPSAGLME